MLLDRVTCILEVVGQRGALSVAEISQHTALPKPTVYRLVRDLCANGLLEQGSTGVFSLGSRLISIVQSDLSDQSLLKVIAPTLKQAAEMHNAAFFLSRLRGRAVEIIHVETPATGVSYLHPGLGRRPLHACSCAKAIAAFMPEILDDDALAGKLKAYTDQTITDLSVLTTEFAAIRKHGFAECVEEIERGICSVAAPVHPIETGKTLAIGATGSTRVFTPIFRKDLGPKVVGIASDVSDALGWTAGQAKGPYDERQSA